MIGVLCPFGFPIQYPIHYKDSIPIKNFYLIILHMATKLARQWCCTVSKYIRAGT